MSVQSKQANNLPQELTPLGSALAGALGGCFSNAVVYPLDVAKTRIQATSSTAKGKRKDDMTMLSVLRDILREEGIMGWYSGFAATMLNTFSSQYAYFFFYSLIRTAYTKRLTSKLPKGSKPPSLSTAAELTLGAIAGALSQIFTIPVSVIATRQQIGKSLRQGAGSHSLLHSGDNESQPYDLNAPTLCVAETEELQDDKDSNSFLNVAREIIREDGITGLWRGLKPSMVLTVNPAITYGVYERLKTILLLAKGTAVAGEKMTPWMSFILGAFSKTLATIVTYPYIMAKVRIQARTSGSDRDEFADRDDRIDDVEKHLGGSSQKHPRGRAKQSGALTLLMQVLKKEGVVGWYQGMSAQIIKAVLSQALLFVSKEQFEHWALGVLVLSSKLRSRS
ncbi:mitochondrial carrier [Pisolithus orientalis]|uniref:mitochondrial carrier n=1 Tax=Pisolithus orientalis TaxID=936130 RepID=UPI002223F4DD|nr:mitochondrial carrier [Pisolithus orientalis]KAI6006607.1 mitochondrial carrier [Pisolithus orientalis]